MPSGLFWGPGLRFKLMCGFCSARAIVVADGEEPEGVEARGLALREQPVSERLAACGAHKDARLHAGG